MIILSWNAHVQYINKVAADPAASRKATITIMEIMTLRRRVCLVLDFSFILFSFWKRRKKKRRSIKHTLLFPFFHLSLLYLHTFIISLLLCNNNIMRNVEQSNRMYDVQEFTDH